MATCGHPTPDGSCDRPVPESADRCFMYDESWAPSSHGAPAGNSNAAGNAGGGAPAGNMNAAKYHGWSDPDLHYQRLEGAAKDWVDDRAEHYTKRADADLEVDVVEKKAQLLATIEHQSWLSLFDILDRGLVVEREREADSTQFIQQTVNPAFSAESRLHNKEWELRDELGLVSEGVLE